MKNVIVVFFVLLLSACSNQTIRMTDSYAVTNANYEKSQPFFIYGLGQTKEINAIKVCRDNGVHHITTQQTFVDGLLGVITLGIYSPRTVAIYCNN